MFKYIYIKNILRQEKIHIYFIILEEVSLAIIHAVIMRKIPSYPIDILIYTINIDF